MKASFSFLFFCFVVFGCGSKDDKQPAPVNTADTLVVPEQMDAGPLDTNDHSKGNASEIRLNSPVGPKKKR